VGNFDSSTALMQLPGAQRIPAFKLFYALGVDGISMPLILRPLHPPLVVIAIDCDEEAGAYYAASDPRRPDIGVFAALKRAAVLRTVGSDADRCSYHRRSGRPAARYRNDQVLPAFLGSVLMLVRSSTVPEPATQGSAAT
jgi:hypothetical protein